MKTLNNITAPALLITAMLVLVLFRRLVFNYAAYDGVGRYIIYNGTEYLPDRFFILVFTANIFAFVMPAFIYIRLLKGDGYLKELYFKLPEFKNATLFIYAAGALMAGTALFGAIIYYRGGELGLIESALDSGGNPVYDISSLLAFVFLPALCEEFMFRSVMLREYEKYGAFAACIISSAAFAAFRFSFALLPAYFTAGVILYIITRASGSILFAAAAHACHNFFILYVWGRLAGVLQFEQNRLIFIFLSAIIFIIFIILLVGKAEKIYLYKAHAGDVPRQAPSGRLAARIKAVFLSPVLIAAGIIYYIICVT